VVYHSHGEKNGKETGLMLFIAATNANKNNMSDQTGETNFKTKKTHSKKEVRVAKFAFAFAAVMCLSLFSFTTPTVNTADGVSSTANHASTQII